LVPLLVAPGVAVGADEAPVVPSASPGLWHAPAPAVDPTRQRIRDLMVGAAFGAVIALLGVLVGAIVAGW
jgi:hypothetical protein